MVDARTKYSLVCEGGEITWCLAQEMLYSSAVIVDRERLVNMFIR